MKPITLSQNLKNSLLKEFEEFLTKERMSDSKINFSRSIVDVIAKDTPKPIVQFTPEAWLKMYTLVQHTAIEIGWHGLVERNDNIFTIKDILLYPQKTTAVTATADDDKYPVWLMSQPDEIFNAIRFQGHSHVNMGVSPSGVDTGYYDDILQTLTKDDYYIFLIMNKRDEIFINIYDFAKNIIFEKGDITLSIMLENQSLIDWAAAEKEKFILNTLTPVATSPGTVISGYGSQGDYNHLSGNTEKKEKLKTPTKKESDDNRRTCFWQNDCHKVNCFGGAVCPDYTSAFSTVGLTSYGRCRY